ncbi:hypothetical protein AB0M43_03375 [Longispora sp. NPDC051575]|uniref:hypothetical protein n=1 Tax=Longispora sp. NPDC051575 TaxID=3154943 RepID=UPI00341EB95D
MVRLVRAAAVTLLALAGSLVAFAGPAHASVTDASCVPPSSNVTTFNPPISLVLAPTVLTYKTTYKPCTSQTVPNLVSGLVNVSSTLNDQCQMNLQTFVVTYTILWNTGATTKVQATHTAYISGSTLVTTYTGTVIAGLFTGSSVVEQQVGSAVELQQCLAGTNRLKSLTSRVSLKIYH